MGALKKKRHWLMYVGIGAGALVAAGAANERREREEKGPNFESLVEEAQAKAMEKHPGVSPEKARELTTYDYLKQTDDLLRRRLAASTILISVVAAEEARVAICREAGAKLNQYDGVVQREFANDVRVAWSLKSQEAKDFAEKQLGQVKEAIRREMDLAAKEADMDFKGICEWYESEAESILGPNDRSEELKLAQQILREVQ